MKHNNITILTLGILIFINLTVTENCCNCHNKCEELSESTQRNDNDNDSYNGNDKGKEETKENNTEDNDYDDEDENDNEDTTNNNEDIDNNNEFIDSNDIKRKRQINGKRKEKHIMNMIPFHRVPVIMYNAVSQTLEPSRKVRQAQGAEITQLAKGISKAIRTRHLSGFVGGLGLHAADFADYLIEISKDVIHEHQRKTRSNEELKIWGKLADRIKARSAGLLSIQDDDENYDKNIQLPFQHIGSTVRELIDLIPAKKTKRYYYKHYKPLANEIIKGINSTQFRSFLKNTFSSDIFLISEDPIQRLTNVRFQRLRTKRNKDKVNEEQN